MDNSQAQDRERAREANIDLRTFEQRRRAFVREHAREEYDTLKRLPKESVEERNAAIGNGAKFVLKGDTVRLGNAVLLREFDQHPTNPDEYVLALGIGLDPSRKPLFGSGPTAEKSRWRVTSTEDLSRVLWELVGSREQATTAWLVEFALDRPAAFASKHNPK
jgi:hypothetical protein